MLTFVMIKIYNIKMYNCFLDLAKNSKIKYIYKMRQDNILLEKGKKIVND